MRIDKPIWNPLSAKWHSLDAKSKLELVRLLRVRTGTEPVRETWLLRNGDISRSSDHGCETWRLVAIRKPLECRALSKADATICPAIIIIIIISRARQQKPRDHHKQRLTVTLVYRSTKVFWSYTPPGILQFVAIGGWDDWLWCSCHSNYTFMDWGDGT